MKRLVKSPKIYFRDSGLLHRASNVGSESALHNHILAGASWEGYVIEEVRKRTRHRWEYYFYRTQKGAEADLVLLAPNGNRAIVEIKLSNAPSVSRGFYETAQDLLPDFKFVITPDSRQYTRDDGTEVLPLRTFLNEVLEKLER